MSVDIATNDNDDGGGWVYIVKAISAIRYHAHIHAAKPEKHARMRATSEHDVNMKRRVGYCCPDGNTFPPLPPPPTAAAAADMPD